MAICMLCSEVSEKVRFPCWCQDRTMGERERQRQREIHMHHHVKTMTCTDLRGGQSEP